MKKTKRSMNPTTLILAALVALPWGAQALAQVNEAAPEAAAEAAEAHPVSSGSSSSTGTNAIREDIRPVHRTQRGVVEMLYPRDRG